MIGISAYPATPTAPPRIITITITMKINVQDKEKFERLVGRVAEMPTLTLPVEVTVQACWKMGVSEKGGIGFTLPEHPVVLRDDRPLLVTMELHRNLFLVSRFLCEHYLAPYLDTAGREWEAPVFTSELTHPLLLQVLSDCCAQSRFEFMDGDVFDAGTHLPVLQETEMALLSQIPCCLNGIFSACCTFLDLPQGFMQAVAREVDVIDTTLRDGQLELGLGKPLDESFDDWSSTFAVKTIIALYDRMGLDRPQPSDLQSILESVPADIRQELEANSLSSLAANLEVIAREPINYQAKLAEAQAVQDLLNASIHRWLGWVPAELT